MDRMYREGGGGVEFGDAFATIISPLNLHPSASLPLRYAVWYGNRDSLLCRVLCSVSVDAVPDCQSPAVRLLAPWLTLGGQIEVLRSEGPALGFMGLSIGGVGRVELPADPGIQETSSNNDVSPTDES
jgi:hypothetical protein